MTSKQSISILTIFLYCFLFFSLSTCFYYVSVSSGFKGLGVPLFGGGDDGRFYYEQAKNVASDQQAILTSIHAVILGWIFKIFQTDEVFLLRAFNFIGNLLTLFVGLKIISILQVGKKNLVASFIFVVLLAYYPSYVLNSNLSIIRDTWIIFYYLLSLLFLINILRFKAVHYKIFYVIMLLLSLYLLYGYRKYAMLGFVVASVLYLLFFHYSKNKNSFNKVIIVSLVGFAGAYTFLKSYQFPIVNMSIESILTYRANGLDVYAGGSQMYISLNQSNVVLFYINYIYSVISNAIGPFPWQFSGMSSIILFFAESILFVCILWILYKNRRHIGKLEQLLLIHSLVWFMLIGIFNDNIGTAARLRMVGWIIIFIVFAKVYTVWLIEKKRSKKTI